MRQTLITWQGKGTVIENTVMDSKLEEVKKILLKHKDAEGMITLMQHNLESVSKEIVNLFPYDT